MMISLELPKITPPKNPLKTGNAKNDGFPKTSILRSKSEGENWVP